MRYLNRTRVIAASAAISALYIALVLGFSSISFLQIQFRVANVLIGLVPILGIPSVIGLSLGVLISNLYSPFGVLDLLSAIPSFLGMLIVYAMRRRSVFAGLTIYSIIISAWVGFMISYIVKAPFIPIFLEVFAGVFLSTTVGGYIVYKSSKRVLERI